MKKDKILTNLCVEQIILIIYYDDMKKIWDIFLNYNSKLIKESIKYFRHCVTFLYFLSYAICDF